ncbi:hypothetical protein [Tsukamurella strandjordii]|uniref:Uncharacterized protein n=1 Tax=Tsukamurella strandjordii TaxID=147577 RepID=A0AA90NHL7_9ACTN|nr:hypothetical protein [Tsukamurella strandjordii]MDP0399238.1 hypothetical protein [Tsukamurella strandjordii]
MTDDKPVSPPLWDRLPKYIRGTRIRTSTAILVVLFVVLMAWYQDLRQQFVPQEERRYGPTAGPTETTPPAANQPWVSGTTTLTRPPSSTTMPSTTPSGSSGAPSSGPSVSGSAAPRPGQPTASGQVPSGTTTVTIPSPTAPTVPQPGGPETGTTAPGGAPTTTVAPG